MTVIFFPFILPFIYDVGRQCCRMAVIRAWPESKCVHVLSTNSRDMEKERKKKQKLCVRWQKSTLSPASLISANNNIIFIFGADHIELYSLLCWTEWVTHTIYEQSTCSPSRKSQILCFTFIYCDEFSLKCIDYLYFLSLYLSLFLLFCMLKALHEWLINWIKERNTVFFHLPANSIFYFLLSIKFSILYEYSLLILIEQKKKIMRRNWKRKKRE